MSPKGIANTFLDRMTNGRFTDVDSVKTSNALSNESKKKIIKSIEKAGKELEQSRKERIDLFGKLEDGEYLGIVEIAVVFMMKIIQMVIHQKSLQNLEKKIL
jgi:hypothetical protein